MHLIFNIILLIANMWCETARSEKRGLVAKLSVSGWANSWNEPRKRLRTMRPLANIMPTCKRFKPENLHKSLDMYYIDICSDFQDLGRCSHKVIGHQRRVVVCNRHLSVAITTHCSHVEHYQWENLSPKDINSISQTTGKRQAIQSMSRMRKRCLRFYYIASILRPGCESKFVILAVGVRPI